MTREMLQATASKTAVHSTGAVAAAGRFRQLLVCLDRSETAEAVLPLASYLARAEGARITLLHVLEVTGNEGRATDALEWDVVREEARSYLERLAERMRGLGIKTDSRVAEGPVPHSVAALAAEIHADLLVLSTYGVGGGEAWALGSTAHKILALAQSPALIVPTGSHAVAPRVPPSRMLVPLDGSIRGECVLPTALRLAREGNAEIVVAHSVADPIRTEVLSTEEDLGLARELADRLASRAEAYLGRISSWLSESAVRARAVVLRCTDTQEGLVSLAIGEQADLVVLSAHGSVCNPRRGFGSTTSYVIDHSVAPVLVIPDLPAQGGQQPSGRPSRLPPRSSDAAANGS